MASTDAGFVPLFQLLARDYPSIGDDVHPVAVFARPKRGSAVRVRTWATPLASLRGSGDENREVQSVKLNWVEAEKGG